jgi:glycosyltransferase involved in cell wall biosynthesis
MLPFVKGMAHMGERSPFTRRPRNYRRTARASRTRALLVVENVSVARDHRLRKQAGALLDAGIDVSVICRADPANGASTGARVYSYPAPPDPTSKLGFVWEYGYSWLMTLGLVLRIAVTRGFDVIQIAGNPDIYFSIAVAFRAFGKRVVFDQRDLAPETFESRYGRSSGILYSLLVWLEKRSYTAADHIVVVNESLRRVALERGAAPADKVTIVGNGPMLSRTIGRAPVPTLKEGRGQLAVWVGLMGPQDSLDIAIRMVDHLVHRLGHTDCQFAFIGDGDARTAIEELVTRLEVGDWVTFTGWLDESGAFDYLATADIGIESNLIAFVSPVKIMEYMAFGLPVVAFDIDETRRLSEVAALLAAPGDVADFARQTADLLDDPELRASLGAAGRRRVETAVAWDHQAKAYLSVIERVLRDDESSP